MRIFNRKRKKSIDDIAENRFRLEARQVEYESMLRNEAWKLEKQRSANNAAKDGTFPTAGAVSKYT